MKLKFALCALALGIAMPAGAQTVDDAQIVACDKEWQLQYVWRQWRRDIAAMGYDGVKLGPNPLFWATPRVLESQIASGKLPAVKLPSFFDLMSPLQRCRVLLAVIRSDGTPEPPPEVRAIISDLFAAAEAKFKADKGRR